MVGFSAWRESDARPAITRQGWGAVTAFLGGLGQFRRSQVDHAEGFPARPDSPPEGIDM
jgi:hypothetical protein